MFVDAGFVYVEPNVRGSYGYGKKWLNADNGVNRLNVITDIEYIGLGIRESWTRNGEAPKNRILGYSYGGYSALMGMSRFSGSYNAGVSVVGIGNFITNLENTSPYRRQMRIQEYGDPVKDREALIKLSPTTYAARVSGPLMIIQGVEDPRVPVSEAIQFHNLLNARSIPSELLLFSDEGHGATKRSGMIKEWGHILRFFKLHLNNEKADGNNPPPSAP